MKPLLRKAVIVVAATIWVIILGIQLWLLWIYGFATPTPSLASIVAFFINAASLAVNLRTTIFLYRGAKRGWSK